MFKFLSAFILMAFFGDIGQAAISESAPSCSTALVEHRQPKYTIRLHPLMEAFLRGDPTRDNILHPVPLQQRPYLFRIECVPGPNGIPKHFYVWGTCHNFPIEATLHPRMLRQLLSSCSHIIGEMIPEESSESKIYARNIQKFRERGLMLEGAAKEAFIHQLAATDISYLTDYEWSEFKDSKIEEKANTYVRSISPLSECAVLRMHDLFIKKKKRELQLEREFILDSVRIQVDSWAECLPKPVKNKILHLLGRNFDLNTLHPTIVHFLHDNKLQGFAQKSRGLDLMIRRCFADCDGNQENVYGLETTQNRLDTGFLDHLTEAVTSETRHGFQEKVNKLAVMKTKPNVEDASEHVFTWNSFFVEYHAGVKRISKNNDSNAAGRDRAWVPVYMPRIQEYVENYSPQPFLMYVGQGHLYYMLQTLGQQPDLIKRITRYDATRGWVGSWS